MGLFPESSKRYANALALLLWAGLLALPFAGVGNTLRIIAATGVLIVLLKLGAVDSFSALRLSLKRNISRLYAASSFISSYAKSPATLLCLVIFLVVFPVFTNDYYRDVMTITGMYIVLALGLNLVVGQAGLLNLGYVAFYAIGAYTYAILSTSFGVSFWPGLALGALVAAGFAVVLGAPTLKLRGDYFAIVTLGMGEITRIILNNWDSMTGGPNGIAKINRPEIGGYVLHTTLDYYYLILLIVIITIFAMHRLISSRIGRAWLAIREDEIAAETMGINTFRLKLLAFVLGSAWAGLIGVFFAAKMAFVSPESFTFFESVLILCMVVLGGMGSIPGIILGAVLLIGLPEVFRDFQDYRMLAFGAALVLMMIFRPQGLLGTVKKTV
jgi:branched-chain amino acid transport system permease protein